jgi:hypothetical protein
MMVNKRPLSTLYQEIASSPCYIRQDESSKRSNVNSALFESMTQFNHTPQNSNEFFNNSSSYTPLFLNQRMTTSDVDNSIAEILSPVDNFTDLELELESSTMREENTNIIIASNNFNEFPSSTSSSSSSSSSSPNHCILQCQDSNISTTNESRLSKKKLINDYFRQSNTNTSSITNHFPTNNFKLKNIHPSSHNNTNNIINSINQYNDQQYSLHINNEMNIEHGNEPTQQFGLQIEEPIANTSDCRCRVCNKTIHNMDYDNHFHTNPNVSKSKVNAIVSTMQLYRCTYCTRPSCLISCSTNCESCHEIFCKFCIGVNYSYDYERVLCPDCNRN